ncbi:MAG: YCF48-related protein [Bacteroidetes bacterium]|nr:YCF48-related protein [Bacteroidota bacterium]
MKKISLLILFLIAFQITRSQDWQWINPKPGGCSLNAVFFANETTGYMVGDDGLIYKTSNGGVTLTPQISNTSKSLYAVQFLNTDNGFAVGKNGTILKTTNGGTEWDVLNSGITSTLHSVFFTSQNTGFSVGDLAKVLKTTNGGISWIEVNIVGDFADYYSVFFANQNTGYIAGSGGQVYKSTDGGVWINEKEENTLVIYPNPATDNLEIVTNRNTGVGRIVISDINGRGLINQAFRGCKTNLNISGLAPGMYFINFRNATTVSTKKIIKE